MPRRIAVLSKKPLSTMRYLDWFRGCEIDLYADIASKPSFDESAELRSFASTRWFDNWKSNHAVELTIIREHRLNRYDAIVASSESDVERAGFLRQTLGIPGQQLSSALGYRDKMAMKRIAQHAGLGVPRYAPIDNPQDLVEFARRYQRFVLKPRFGAGSAGIFLAESDDDLSAILSSIYRCGDRPAQLLAEELVEAQMLVVDGFTDGENLLAYTVSEHIGSCLDTVRLNNPTAVVHVDERRADAQEAIEYTRKLVESLPSPGLAIAIHCELFLRPNNEVILCEIASRAGGSGVRWAFRRRTGLDLEEVSCKSQAGLESDFSTRKNRYAGYVHVPNRNGIVARAHSDCDIPGVIAVESNLSEGARTSGSTKVSEVGAIVYFEKESAEEARALAESVLPWAKESFRWIGQ